MIGDVFFNFDVESVRRLALLELVRSIRFFSSVQISDQGFDVNSRVDPIELTRLNEGKKDGHGQSTVFRMGAIPSFATDDRISEQSLLRIIVDWQIWDRQEEREFIIVVEKILDGFGDGTLAGILKQGIESPLPHHLKQGPHQGANIENLLGGLATSLGLEMIDFSVEVEKKLGVLPKSILSPLEVPSTMSVAVDILNQSEARLSAAFIGISHCLGVATKNVAHQILALRALEQFGGYVSGTGIPRLIVAGRRRGKAPEVPSGLVIALEHPVGRLVGMKNSSTEDLILDAKINFGNKISQTMGRIDQRVGRQIFESASSRDRCVPFYRNQVAILTQGHVNHHGVIKDSSRNDSLGSRRRFDVPVTLLATVLVPELPDDDILSWHHCQELRVLSHSSILHMQTAAITTGQLLKFDMSLNQGSVWISLTWELNAGFLRLLGIFITARLTWNPWLFFRTFPKKFVLQDDVLTIDQQGLLLELLSQAFELLDSGPAVTNKTSLCLDKSDEFLFATLG